MKTLVIEHPTRDIQGLVEHLKKIEPDLGVISVATDPRRTYVYVKDGMETDPLPHVAEWQDPGQLLIASLGSPGEDGIPQAAADGVGVHFLEIQKVSVDTGDLLAGDEEIEVSILPNIPIDTPTVYLKNGIARITVGPTNSPGEAVVRAIAKNRKFGSTDIRVRFAALTPAAIAAEEAEAESEPQERGFFAMLKRLKNKVF